MLKIKNRKSMKALNNLVKIAIGGFLLSVLAVSCLPKEESMDGAGQVLVRYTPADQFSLKAISPLATPQVIDLLSFKRDIPNETALSQTTTVVVTLDATSAMIDKYNELNETEFILMPADKYTTTPAMSGGAITYTYGKGDFEKSLIVTIPNASSFDFSKAYMLAFKVTVTGEGVLSKSVSDTIYRQIMATNRFDGQYEVTGTLVDLANAAIGGNYPMTVNLVTTGENQVRFEEPADDPWGSVIFHSITSGGAMSVYGSFGLVVNFDASNSVVSIVNYYGQPAGNTRSAELDPSGVNTWNPTTKTIKIKYFMKQPSVVTTAPYIRTTFDETWTYKGPRE
jgi:hypothetical protein